MIQVKVPDVGSEDALEVIEILVVVGESVELEQSIVVLESEKATIEVPCPTAGVVKEMNVKIGDKIHESDLLLCLESIEGVSESEHPTEPEIKNPEIKKEAEPEPRAEKESAPALETKQQLEEVISTQVISTQAISPEPSTTATVHAGPAARKRARELGVGLENVKGSGPKNRILKEDIYAWVKQRMQGQAAGTSAMVEDLPDIDFSKFGVTNEVSLSKIRKVSSANLSRSWRIIPHVTQFDEADITELEKFRKEQNQSKKNDGIKLTMLAFLVSACAKALEEFPQFNASLRPDGEVLVMKEYCHIGIAVDTPNGLVVPVIRDADKKGIADIAREMTVLSEKARNRKLMPGDMQGGCFSISSLGGIGGTAFTPIVNWPEVAILGVSRSEIKPHYIEGGFVPRLKLPLSLSYDHRVIDGADAARFMSFLSGLLADMRKRLL